MPAEEPETIIELTDSIEPEDIVEDVCTEEVAEGRLEVGNDLDPKPVTDDEPLVEIIENDLLSVDVVEEITEDDLMPAEQRR